MWRNKWRHRFGHGNSFRKPGISCFDGGERELCLLDLQPGQTGEVAGISCQGAIRRRIMDMGLVPGAEVELVRYAPMGDPVVVKVCNYLLSLRKSEASGIMICPGAGRG